MIATHDATASRLGEPPRPACGPGTALHDVVAPHALPTRGGRPVRVLVFTSLYPNVEQPRHGLFVEERLLKLIGSGRIAATVVAPVPWFPFRARRFGAYATLARVPQREQRSGITVLHPRYPAIPKVGMGIAPTLMYRTLLPCVRRLLASGPGIDLISSHYLYPDGVAASLLGAAVGKPVVICAHGSDLNVISRYRLPQRQIRRAVDRAAAVITVSRALKRRAEDLGAAPGKVTVLRNGVDLDQFRPRDRGAIRERLGLSGTVWLAVGHLTEAKGVHIAISALARVATATLLVAGEGPDESGLRQLARQLGVAERVRFLGAVAHDQLAGYYSAADVLVLASAREGMPMVVLEAIACGTPVIATAVGGIPEVVNSPEAGELMRGRNPDALVEAWNALQQRAPDRRLTRQLGETFGWTSVVGAETALYRRVLGLPE